MVILVMQDDHMVIWSWLDMVRYGMVIDMIRYPIHCNVMNFSDTQSIFSSLT